MSELCLLALFAAIHPKPEHRQDAIAALEGILEQTRAEDGCLRFELNVGDPGDPQLYLVALWKDDDALKAHYAQGYTREAFEIYQDWLAEPIASTRMRRQG